MLFRTWSGEIELPILGFVDLPEGGSPGERLAALGAAVLAAEQHAGGAIEAHAVGSLWAFSAPGHCDGLVIRTEALRHFPDFLQRSIIQPERGHGQVLVAVEAGIKIRALYQALTPGQARFDAGEGGLPAPAALAGRDLTLPVLGGAGGQSIAGAISTGTHGGDVARPPLSDFVHAALMVGSGGQLRLLQRASAPAVDGNRLAGELQALLGQVDLRVITEDEALDAAMVSVGRFGVVYAYVLEVHDESAVFKVEHRRWAGWLELRDQLVAMIAEAAARDEFLQVLINPQHDERGDHRCYVTEHKLLPRDAVAEAGAAFGLPAGIGSSPVAAERSAPTAAIGQLFCGRALTAELRVAQTVLTTLGLVLAVTVPIWGVVAALILSRMVAALDRVGPRDILGDVVAELLNEATRLNLPFVAELITSAVVEGSQSAVRAARDASGRPLPWLVHGRRWEVADLFDYDSDCFRGQSVEIFMPVDPLLPARLERLFDLFAALRRRGVPVGGYVSTRYMARSRTLLSPAAFAPSCSVEVALLRGMEGNAELLAEIQRLAVEMGGRVHWGQRHDLDAATVSRLHGEAMAAWRRQLAAQEGLSPTFSSRFTRQRGLEPERPAAWAGWQTTDLTAGGPVHAVSTAVRHGVVHPLQLFALDPQQRIVQQRRPAGAPEPWRPVRGEPVATGTQPVAVRGESGRIELLVRGVDNRLWRTYEQDRPGGAFADWDVLGGRFGRPIADRPTVVMHKDGRLEAFARGADSEEFRLLHSWATLVNHPWVGFEPRGGPIRLGAPPSACPRRFFHIDSFTDQLLVVARDEDGAVIWMAQTGPGGDSGWTEWARLAGPNGREQRGGGAPLAVDLFGEGEGVAVLAVDDAGRLWESRELGMGVGVQFADWRLLPAGPSLDPTIPPVAATTSDAWLFAATHTRAVAAIRCVRGGSWEAWQMLGGQIAGPITGGAVDQRVEVVTLRHDGQVMARRQAAPGVW